jgi:nicotinate-nucleotide pyrophosphorylase (carboxylating)
LAPYGFAFGRRICILGGVDELKPELIERAVRNALAEDVGSGDVTTLSLVPPELKADASLNARHPMVFCGSAFARSAFRQVSPELQVTQLVRDGESVTSGTRLMRVVGPAAAILTAERVALNFVQRLSGVATLTAQFVEAVRGTHARILDTRKTTPGWRLFEKYAVHCGGGQNHRMGLYDMVLIKDNHLAALRSAPPNPIAAAIQRARARYPGLKIEVETDTLEQVDQALAAGAEIILLDNMELPQLRQAVENCDGRALTEASGGSA